MHGAKRTPIRHPERSVAESKDLYLSAGAKAAVGWSGLAFRMVVGFFHRLRPQIVRGPSTPLRSAQDDGEGWLRR